MQQVVLIFRIRKNHSLRTRKTEQNSDSEIKISQASEVALKYHNASDFVLLLL